MTKKRKWKKALSVKAGKQTAVATPATPATDHVVIQIPAEVCRLCQTEDGPFLNIFGGVKNTAKKIEEMMPFSVAENDELPHNICFRCSAKVEELHEFIQKCTKTQQSFYNSLGKECPSTSKTKTHRSLWEETLNKSNITNDDICDAVIKKAMEGIKDITLPPEDPKADTGLKEKISLNKNLVVRVPRPGQYTQTKDDCGSKTKDDCGSKIKDDCGSKTKNNVETSETILEKNEKPQTRSTRARNNASLNTSPKNQSGTKANVSNTTIESPQDINGVLENNKDEQKEPVPKPFNIMDHVSMIKVNGVGVLFQCSLCNRNFLKEEIVLTHWCAKNGAAKKDVLKPIKPPEVKKAPTVKYINTNNNANSKSQRTIDSNIDTPNKKNDNVNSQSKGNIHLNIDTPNKKNDNVNSQSKGNIHLNLDTPKNKEPIEIKPVGSTNKPKPKIGPASKVKKTSNQSVLIIGTKVTPKQPSPPPPPPPPPPAAPVKKAGPSFTKVTPIATSPPQASENAESFVQCAVTPSLNCRYKLVPGPNNTFNLVEVSPNKQMGNGKGKKRPSETVQDGPERASKEPRLGSSRVIKETESEVIDLDEIMSVKEEPVSQPYPVGLFQSMKPHSSEPVPSTSGVIPFTTTVQKKQSYTIVQTGNPSKLLISAKPQHQLRQPEKSKKVKPLEPKPINDEPFSVTLEDVTPSSDPELYNFMNLDPLLQPSYVLPTDSSIIVPETQPATSQQVGDNSVKGKVYACNMCGKKFSREQKLLAHIHAHYEKMDEEDSMRQEKVTKKRGKKS